MGRTINQKAQFSHPLVEERVKQELNLLTPPSKAPTKVSKKNSKTDVVKKKRAHPQKEIPWLTNSREGKSQEWIEAIEILERQAVRSRPWIDIPNKKKRTTPKEEAKDKEDGCKRINIGRKFMKQTYTANDTDLETIHYYPRTPEERKEFVNPVTGKHITDFQYKAYDLLAQIPRGQVTTYKILSDILKSSPIYIGGASHNNPFWPFPVPCHRLICTDGFIGGPLPADHTDSQFIANKKAKLIMEGVEFDEGYNFVKNGSGTKDMFKDFDTQNL